MFKDTSYAWAKNEHRLDVFTSCVNGLGNRIDPICLSTDALVDDDLTNRQMTRALTKLHLSGP